MTSILFRDLVPTVLPYLYVLLALTCFSGASVWYGEYARRYGSAWMTIVKASVASLAFLVCSLGLVLLNSQELANFFHPKSLFFLLSGAIGLGLGDILIIRAFSVLGSARTLLIFSFQPLLLGLQAYLFFGQVTSWMQIYTILFLILCVWLMLWEQAQKTGRWQIAGALAAVFGVILDNIGVIMSRHAFDETGLHVMPANLIRTFGAIGILWIWLRLKGQPILPPIFELSKKDKSILLVSSFAGTFLSLTLWLSAIKVGHLATLSAVSGLGPLVASLWEWKILGKKPSRVFFLCLLLTLPGVALLLLQS